MQLFYGNYPALEKEFLAFTCKNRHHPLEKWLVICASSFMAQELRTRLAREMGALANIHFITVGGLISQLDAQEESQLPLFPQDHLRDFLLKEILTEPGLDRYPVSNGFVQAVKSALRDMSDSLVDPDVLQEHTLSLPDSVLEQEGDRLLWLNRVYRRYMEQENKIPGYRSYQDAFEHALKEAEKGTYLKEFQQIIWYGFYELSGRQLEFFDRIKSKYPLTVFAAYNRHPAYQFARKFFETNWLSIPGATALPEETSGALKESAACLFSSEKSTPCENVQLVNAADMQGEVFFAAKEILRLVEQGKCNFDEIAIIARTSAPYQEEIRRVFETNKIPLNASFSYSLSHYALGVFCKGLFHLSKDGFSRNAMLQLISSPYFKHSSKRNWRELIRRSLVSRDLSQWRDLLPRKEEESLSFLNWLEQLAARLEQLASPAKWEESVSLALQLLQELVDPTAFQGKDEEIFQQICQTVEKMKTYGVLRPFSQRGEFLREIEDALASLTFNEAESIPTGVLFTDALRARGIQRKFVFILGLNDRSFPQVISEDPILKDYYRYILRDVLGYWINQSLERFDEEKLLFYVALTAAKEKIYVTYYRRGEDGKEAVPSVYLAELARACQLDLQSQGTIRVGGALQEQLANTDLSLWTSKEMSYACVLDSSNTNELLRQADLLDQEKENSLTAATALHNRGELGPYDGIIRSGKELFDSQNRKGFSPSALQELASCPLKYFFNKGLGLSEPDTPLSRQELAADQKGNAYHEILHEFYDMLYKKHLTHSLFPSGVNEYLNRVFEKHYKSNSYKAFGIYPVVWELIVENIRQKLTAFVQEDLQQLGSFVPSKFEQPVSLAPTMELPIRLRGIIDRLDINEKEKTFFVVDYKSSRKGTKDLAADLFTHLIFQPFLYVFIALHLEELKDYTSAGSCLLSIQPKYDKRTLSADSFQAVREHACRFFTQITDLIKQGVFFLFPSDLCQYCPYSTICRRDNFFSLLRARKSEASKLLEEARK